MANAPLVEQARRLRHDLGKYVSLQVRWLGEGASADSLREALVADLLTTRRGPDGATDAWALWEELRPGWQGSWAQDPDVAQIDSAMMELRAVIEAARAGTLRDGQVAHGVALAQRVTEATRSLAARVQQEG